MGARVGIVGAGVQGGLAGTHLLGGTASLSQVCLLREAPCTWPHPLWKRLWQARAHFSFSA